MTDPFRRLSPAQQKLECQQWAKDHGHAFYRSVWPNGIPRELLASFGIWITPKAKTT